MSQRNSASNRDDGVVQKQPLNVYTVMLVIAFCAISLACLLLYLELGRWGSFPWWKPASGAATSFLHQVNSLDLPHLTRLG